MSEQSGRQELPCFYTFKVFGRRSDTFLDRVRAVVAATLGPVPLDSIKVRASAAGRYVSVIIVPRVETRAQLEQVYTDLRDDEEVLLYI